jgi:hypothetical protein
MELTPIIFDMEVNLDNSSSTRTTPAEFVIDMNEVARYLVMQGAPFFLRSHSAFMAAYSKAWREQSKDQQAVVDVPDSSYRKENSKSSRAFPFIGLKPVFLLGLYVSWYRSVWDAISDNASKVPPLIAAVVVIFITSDAWDLFGTGFTVRLVALWCLTMGVSLLMLIKYDYWQDLAVGEDGDHILQTVRPSPRAALRNFIDCGAEARVDREVCQRIGSMYVLINYVLLSILSLIGIAASVTLAVFIIGVLLVGVNATHQLSGAVNVDLIIPGDFVVTTQLVSLSITMGVFATFFFISGQKAEERRAFVQQSLQRLRRLLMVYSLYYQARANAPKWTEVTF